MDLSLARPGENHRQVTKMFEVRSNNQETVPIKWSCILHNQYFLWVFFLDSHILLLLAMLPLPQLDKFPGFVKLLLPNQAVKKAFCFLKTINKGLKLSQTNGCMGRKGTTVFLSVFCGSLDLLFLSAGLNINELFPNGDIHHMRKLTLSWQMSDNTKWKNGYLSKENKIL